MNIYRATFADGTTKTIETLKPVTHAWRLILKDDSSKIGFSGSQTAAYKAMNRAFKKVKYSKAWALIPVEVL